MIFKPFCDFNYTSIDPEIEGEPLIYIIESVQCQIDVSLFVYAFAFIIFILAIKILWQR